MVDRLAVWSQAAEACGSERGGSECDRGVSKSARAQPPPVI